MKIRAAKAPNRELFWWLHIIIYGLLGVMLICMLSSSRMISAFCSVLINRGVNLLKLPAVRPEILETLFLYGKYFIWSMELVFCLSFFFRGSLRSLKTAFAIAFTFDAMLILVQFFFLLHGNFYVGNVLSVFLGFLISASVILIHERALI